jgi:hypothetical protein
MSAHSKEKGGQGVPLERAGILGRSNSSLVKLNLEVCRGMLKIRIRRQLLRYLSLALLFHFMIGLSSFLDCMQYEIIFSTTH